MTARRDGWAIRRELIADAVATLAAVRQRSLLALIGIAIGTASVIAMLNIGHNARLESERRFLAMGTDLLVVQKSYTVDAADTAIRLDDAVRLGDHVTAIAAVAPTVLTSAALRAHRTRTDATVVGATASLAPIAKLSLQAGRFVSDFDGARTFAVIGATVAETLGAPGRPLALGDAVQIGAYAFTVIGLLADTAQSPLLPADFNTAVIVPLPSARRITPDPQITTVIARLRPGADDGATAAAVTAYFTDRLRGDAIEVRTARQLIAGLARQMQVYTLLLAAIGGISLVVGGVGVMNVMLMGVIERRREIGLRLALGARRRDIRTMFLVEAVVLASVGGGVGTLLGLGAAFAFAFASGWRFDLAVAVLPLAAGVAAAVGLFFGIYPAVSAARQDPITALRAD